MNQEKFNEKLLDELQRLNVNLNDGGIVSQMMTTNILLTSLCEGIKKNNVLIAEMLIKFTTQIIQMQLKKEDHGLEKIILL